MTARFPLVMVSGSERELPAGDNLADPTLAAVAQVAGLDGTTLLEVDANTKAGRVTLRANDGGSFIEQAFDVGHYAVGWIGGYALTTTFPANADLGLVSWFGPGYAVLRKIWVTMATTALVGARAGMARCFLQEVKSNTGSPGTNQWVMPPINNANMLNATQSSIQNFHSLRQRQLAPQIVISTPGNLVGPASAPLTFTGTPNTGKTLADIIFGAKSVIGTDLPPTAMIDTYAGGQPIVLEPAQGVLVSCTYPVAATSQNIQFTVNIVWDEWYPMPQVVL